MADPIIVTDEDLHETALTILGEADNQELIGKIMVAWVIRTRATWRPSAWWGDTPAKVCLHPFQFSCRNPGTPLAERLLQTPATDMRYQLAFGVAKQVFAGTFPNPADDLLGPDGSVGPVTHYKVVGSKASWDKAAAPLPSKIIGAHQAWRLGPSA